MATNVPKVVFGPNGFQAPPEDEIVAGVMLDMQDAFGGNLNPALESPQGQLASSEASIIGNANDTFIYYTNQVDPAYAQGRMQDAIGRIYNLERKSSQPTVVSAVCSGLTGVVIPIGSLALAIDGNIYQSTEEATIPIGGSTTVQFACTVNGAIPCPDGSLNQIYKAVNGWESILNLVDGVIGNDVESRSEFEARRQASVALNSRGSMPSILGAVLNVDDVLDAYVTENVNDTPITIRGATLAPHSLYVAAVGGLAQDVGEAIWTKKSPGCAYNGNTTVVVVDDSSGYSFPYPQYNVTFEIPDALQVLFAVNLINNANVPDNAVALIQNAIVSAFSGGDGGVRARIGSTIFASRYYAPVAALGAWAQIVSITVGSANTPQVTFTASISGLVMTVTAVALGTLAVGQTISDAASVIPAGTHIVSLGTGTGGTGTYNLNITQVVSSRVMKASRPTSNQVEVNINQVPTISIGDIAVTLT